MQRLHEHLREQLAFPFAITIADNASTDGTLALARAPRRTSCREVRVLHLERKGRGRALRAAWGASERRRGRLHGRRPLDRPRRACETLARARCSRAAATSRSARGSRPAPQVTRSLAARADLAHLQPAAARWRCTSASPTPSAASRPRRSAVIAGAARGGPRTRSGSSTPSCCTSPSAAGSSIHEVPVRWVEDPDSRVDIVATAREDLRGVMRLRGGRGPADERHRAAARPERPSRLSARRHTRADASARAARQPCCGAGVRRGRVVDRPRPAGAARRQPRATTRSAPSRLAEKVLALRVFPDADGQMNEALGDREILCVSQFTLYGDTRRGNRPSFIAAARPESAEPLYERFCERAGARRGVFGAHMDVELVGDGPVTVMLEM